MKKIKAFTLIELLVAMVISSLVITFAYMGYAFILKYYMDFRKVNNELNDVMLASTTFQNDFHSAEKVTRQDMDIKMSRRGKQITYSINTNAFIRNEEGVRDTFHISIYRVSSFFKEKEILSGNILLDKLVLEADLQNQKEKLIFNKVYGSDVLMHQDSLLKAFQ